MLDFVYILTFMGMYSLLFYLFWILKLSKMRMIGFHIDFSSLLDNGLAMTDYLPSVMKKRC